MVGWDPKFGLVKISPLANWTRADVWKRILEEKIPYNPLHDRGYPSVGCRPCTRSVMFDEDERAGRWSGTAKSECGLHIAEGAASDLLPKGRPTEVSENRRADEEPDVHGGVHATKGETDGQIESENQ